MRRENGSLLGLYTIGIAMLFLAGFFLLVVFGAGSYRNTVAQQHDNTEKRALLSYFSTTVKGYDSEGAVELKDTEYGTMLQVADGSSGYALKIYCQDGKLLEEYARKEAALSPERAQTIGETERFSAELSGQTLRIFTDAGSVLLRLRSEGGSS